ncbi:hypothetical protein [Spirosoma montaniterrae]|uniref:Uncharacterized protein n=1 Tax=Spirosoma montaniterrae TaxID=1178516 RepID=A0A1P9WZI9_9BACT|nr:hypothetical protein [Spirosoma montaniterrae]AQG80748.1 hypothetical protein AWR27_16320 [Spirosoma montaniterrae]
MNRIVGCLLGSLLCLFGCEPANLTSQTEPLINQDSVRCVQTWQKFQLPNDTILTLKYQQPVRLMDGADTMSITVTRIDDFCTEEGEKTTYGCVAKVRLEVSLNNKCVFTSKEGLEIGRRNALPVYTDFSTVKCNWYSNQIVSDPLASSAFVFYNSLILFNRLTPFAKNLQEFQDLTLNKHKYTVTLWLKKRCL